MNLQIFIGVFVLLTGYIFISGRIDKNKKRSPHKNPKISIIIPCYNDGDSIEETIESIYESYPKEYIQLIIVNDNSTDNSKEVIDKLQKKYAFEAIHNAHNTGKSHILNHATDKAKNDILIFLDADTLLNKKALNDMLTRIEHNNKVTAVSCPYRPHNKGFLPLMQNIEYNIARFTNASYNHTSAIILWGGCIAIKKESFIKAGKFSINAISEDMDLALKINEQGEKVQNSLYTVDSVVPNTLRGRYKQKIRWSSGGLQCLITHFKVWIKNPIFVIFTVMLSITMMNGTFYLIKNSITFGNFIEFSITLLQMTTFSNGMNVLQALYGDNMVAATTKSLAYTRFALPYVIPMITKRKKIVNILLIIPYGIIYAPMHGIVRTIGSIQGIKRYFELKKGKRAW